jgi:hypothetical protein
MEIKEIWKDITGYEGLYQVSNLGRVKSLARFINRSDRPYYSQEKIIKGGYDKRGYCTMTLCDNLGKKKYIRVHQLVAIEFLNHKPCRFEKIIDHINNDKKNNSVFNLQITTTRNNTSKDKINKTSKYTGVYWHKSHKTWNAAIRINGIKKHLGTFSDEISASIAYNNVLIQISK